MRKQALQYLMDRMNEERVNMLPPSYKRLTETACIRWAYKPVWTYHEATFLALGYWSHLTLGAMNTARKSWLPRWELLSYAGMLVLSRRY